MAELVSYLTTSHSRKPLTLSSPVPTSFPLSHARRCHSLVLAGAAIKHSTEQTQCRLVICWLIKMNHLSAGLHGHQTKQRRKRNRYGSSEGATCQTAYRNWGYKNSHPTFLWIQPQRYLNSSFARLAEFTPGTRDKTWIPALRLKPWALSPSKLKLHSSPLLNNAFKSLLICWILV